MTERRPELQSSATSAPQERSASQFCTSKSPPDPSKIDRHAALLASAYPAVGRQSSNASSASERCSPGDSSSRASWASLWPVMASWSASIANSCFRTSSTLNPPASAPVRSRRKAMLPVTPANTSAGSACRHLSASGLLRADADGRRGSWPQAPWLPSRFLALSAGRRDGGDAAGGRNALGEPVAVRKGAGDEPSTPMWGAGLRVPPTKAGRRGNKRSMDADERSPRRRRLLGGPSWRWCDGDR
mmetsp:Transcript_75925/g.220459  ORF Transcript_75925/g.220459 Transcript_75925/m.220459 type:complete len:244 (-) Transcript_75925:988-1719(-)